MPPLPSLNCPHSLEKLIIVASHLDEKLTFSEDFRGPSEKIRPQPRGGGGPSSRPAASLLPLTRLMGMDSVRSFSAFEL